MSAWGYEPYHCVRPPRMVVRYSPSRGVAPTLESGVSHGKNFPILMLLVAFAGLAACAASDSGGTGAGYVGRFDNDENRRPMLIDNAGQSSSPHSIIYGDGEH